MICLNKTGDKYDRAIWYLSANPNEIFYAWGSPRSHKAGCLFNYTSAIGHGCLVQIRCSKLTVAPTWRLTEKIKTDEGIPKDPDDIEIQHLERFATWQHRLDEKLGKKRQLPGAWITIEVK